MKNYLTYAIAAFFATTILAIAAPDEASLKAKETAAWQAFKDKKGDDFKKIVSANMIGVYPDGIQNLQKEMDSMQQWDMKSFTISDYKVTAAGDDTAVTTYMIKLDGTMAGKDASGTYNAGSVWKKEGGEWKAIFHTNIPQQLAAK
jgi:ketosteroid isomerase-like protein